jgi:hypothetical protein
MRWMCNPPCARFWASTRDGRAGKIERIGWGLFLIWVGGALLFDVGWGVGLLGVGLLALVMQVVRSNLGLRVEVFWVLVGSALVLAGVWNLAALSVSLGPVLLVLLGIAVLLSVAAARSQ